MELKEVKQVVEKALREANIHPEIIEGCLASITDSNFISLGDEGTTDEIWAQTLKTLGLDNSEEAPKKQPRTSAIYIDSDPEDFPY